MKSYFIIRLKQFFVASFVAASFCASTNADIATIPLQEAAVIFQYLNGGTPNAVTLNVGEDVNGYTYRSLILFDLSEIPSDPDYQVVVLSASLSLTTKTFRNWPEVTISLHRLTESWVNDPGNVSWSKRDASTNWSTLGGSFEGTASSTLTGQFAMANETNSFVGLEQDVQFWIDNPDQNFGWILVNHQDSESNNFKSFYGHYDPSNPTWFPMTLTVEYMLLPIPEVSTFGQLLFGAGFLAFFRLRKRTVS